MLAVEAALWKQDRPVHQSSCTKDAEGEGTELPLPLSIGEEKPREGVSL
jgi:hypothetical protein